MIAWNDLQKIANFQRVSPFVVLREYVQILFLNGLYSLDNADNIVFKGGTCLRLIHNSNRFSEDLDFTTDFSSSQIGSLVAQAVGLVTKETPPINIKTVKTISGFTQKLSMLTIYSPTSISIKLDFSQRELVLQKNQKPISSILPISSFYPITHMEMTEILAEKCRAIVSRHKGRDIYDLWYLLQRKTPIDVGLIQKKLDYYQQKFDLNELIKNIKSWEFEKFSQDVRGFLPEPDRQTLPFVIPTLIEKLKDAMIT
ncbi:MAG: hypothetical protein UU42_C0012G0008 [Candidatus Woesebacteria bacterium GW2011_GWA1_41_13b]|uniref:Nucleotidyl transferase AbiEii/AbiGii toxin family protein n=1 Tax=Candidatus Woesebacteria bacterium GW2011_GWA1_41_13b TaxID=1618555 RepID=A0A0G0UV43_9BACT|nr:MAG: hypothetical protein UU42_C0012G0008 [Candidatus Woesebacteria bacterium GW2011_GWA1_41_13b]